MWGAPKLEIHSPVRVRYGGIRRRSASPLKPKILINGAFFVPGSGWLFNYNIIHYIIEVVPYKNQYNSYIYQNQSFFQTVAGRSVRSVRSGRPYDGTRVIKPVPRWSY